MYKLILDLIVGLHIIFVLFVILTPFYGNNYLLMLHGIAVPFMMLHWVLNDNSCALTIIEKSVREQLYGTVNSSECFTCRLIEPVYDFKNNYESLSNTIYAVTLGLWLISVYKLTCRFRAGEIRSLKDLFKY
jgi:hypothetical protein